MDALARGRLRDAALRRHEVGPAAPRQGPCRRHAQKHAPAAGRHGGRRHPDRACPGRHDLCPGYDPDVVYDAPDGYAGPFITFGIGFPVGAWLGFECDWDDFGIWVRPWHPGWGYRRDWQDARWGGSRWHVDPAPGRDLVRNYYRPEGNIRRPGLPAAARGPARGPNAGFHPSAAPAEPRMDYRGLFRRARPRHPGGALWRLQPGHAGSHYSSRGQSSRQAPGPGLRPVPGRRKGPALKPDPGGKPPASIEIHDRTMKSLRQKARLAAAVLPQPRMLAGALARAQAADPSGAAAPFQLARRGPEGAHAATKAGDRAQSTPSSGRT
jgi:hypothetical protein